MPFSPELQSRIDAARSGLTADPAQDELSVLKRKLKAREGHPGFKANCEELRARIAELEAQNGE